MTRPVDRIEARRSFLKFLAGSPALAAMGLPALLHEYMLAAAAERPQSTRQYAGLGDDVIKSPEHAINVFDFERAARNELPPGHWGYLATGTDDDGTIEANRAGFTKFRLRPRRLVDVREIDMSTDLFGTTWPTPIVISPCGHQMAFHPEGEVAVARAARAKNHLQILSTVTSIPVEEVAAARGAPLWFQLYARYNWDVTAAVVKRAEAAGCAAVALTVDLQGGSNRETVKAYAKRDQRDCLSCHVPGFVEPMFQGLDIATGSDYPRGLSWDFVDRLKDLTTMKVLVKGIVTAEDARLAVDHGLDGIIVSNHGGRAEASLRSTIECLPEITEAVQGRLTVLIDSGFRRGTDFFKALALGANAVCIGRPYLWGLASFGQVGVEAVLEILRRELQIVMRQAGTTSIGQITRSHIAERTA